MKNYLSQGCGFTIIEVLCSVTVASFIVGVLFYALSSAEYSRAASAAKIEVQSEVRRSIDWIVKDVRQAVSWEIADADNSPSNTHIKFRKVEGWNTTAETFLLSADYTEYTYDSGDDRITRRLSDSDDETKQTWSLNHIQRAPFYTLDGSGNVVALNGGDLLTSRKLVIDIRGSKPIKGSLNATATLIEEVKIRNE
ncbi:MAG: hypothetical protein ABIG31_01940 [Candidatus Omnitrophota bacterium]